MSCWGWLNLSHLLMELIDEQLRVGGAKMYCGENLFGKSQGGSKKKFTAAGTQILFECISQSQVDGG